MIVKSIKISQKSRLGMNDYHGVDLECSMYAELDEMDDPEERIEELSEIVRDNIRARATPFLPFVHLSYVPGGPEVTVRELYQSRPVVDE